jgi:hypothetical protein
MKICKKCGIEFPFLVKINGVTKNLNSRKFCITCSPFGSRNTTDLQRPAPKSTIDKLSLSEFSTLVKTSLSRGDILFKLKLRKSGASFLILNRRLKSENIDISHFLNGGNTRATHDCKKYSDSDVYCANSKIRSIRIRALNDKIMDYKCKKCNIINDWNNEPLTLELDHINGDRYDNRKENLRWLCPNCHSQTETFCKKRRT